MKYKEISFKISQQYTELVADIVGEYSCEGVSIFDPQDIVDILQNKKIIWDYVDDSLQNPPSFSVVTGYFDPDFDISELEYRIKEHDEDASVTQIMIENEDYINTWKSFFTPKNIGKLTILPEWLRQERTSGVPVVLDIGTAFGTGEHETTQMCLQLLQECDVAQKNIADIGCGSGILGIAALKLGAKTATLIDLDPLAVQAAHTNCALNGVNADIIEANLLDINTTGFDIVLANITADVLCQLASSLPCKLAKNSVVIVSGIINAKRDLVQSTYQRHGFTTLHALTVGEWSAFSFAFSDKKL